MPDSAFRDFTSFCPKRFDVLVMEPSQIQGVPPRPRSVVRTHEWRQEVAFSEDGQPIPGLFYCCACMAGIQATQTDIRLTRYFGEQDEVIAWNEYRAKQREAEAEAFNEGS